MASRPPVTAADYMVVALSPTLIFLLVGSLCFFLVEVFYQGDYPYRLLFVMAMFVMGIVALSRLAMEEGWAYCFLYAVGLAVVVAIALATFVQIRGPLAPFGFFINIGLMGLIWWSSYKLVWDCTLIDEDQDSSGEGLLQAVGLDAMEGEASAPAAAGRGSRLSADDELPADNSAHDTDALSSTEADATPEARLFIWFQKLLEPDRRPHAPGKWVIYFSLAALPLFGLGQWFIPVEKLGSRRFAFWMMAIYVASGLLLLLNTSFLGLRRYLRQRRLTMPLDMAVTWLTVGTMMVLALLAVVYLLPSPSPEYSISQLDVFKSRNYDASRYSPGGPDGSKQGESQQKTGSENAEKQGGEKSQDKSGGEKSGDKSGQNSASQNDKSQSQQNSKDGSKGSGQPDKSGDKSKSEQGDKGKEEGEKQGGQKTQNQNNQSSGQKSDAKSGAPSKSQGSKSGKQEQQSQNQQSASQAKPPPPRQPFQPSKLIPQISSSLGTILKWLFYGALVISALVAAWIYRKELLAAWNKLLAELRELWARWFGIKPQAAEVQAALAMPPRTFASYADPFASGLVGRANLLELVRYSFEALEAWGRDHGAPRSTGQTPHEFTQQLGDLDDSVARETRQLADLYCQIAYARSLPAGGVEILRGFWQRMGTTR